MRYLGLVFLGLVLSAGQASAEVLRDMDAAKIFRDGKIAHKNNATGLQIFRYGVIYKGQYFVCMDDINRDSKLARFNCYGTMVGN